MHHNHNYLSLLALHSHVLIAVPVCPLLPLLLLLLLSPPLSLQLLPPSLMSPRLLLSPPSLLLLPAAAANDAAGPMQQTLVVGIIDYIRTFTWDKRLEMWIKSTGILGGSGNLPTVVSPSEYAPLWRGCFLPRSSFQLSAV